MKAAGVVFLKGAVKAMSWGELREIILNWLLT